MELPLSNRTTSRLFGLQSPMTSTVYYTGYVGSQKICVYKYGGKSCDL